MPDLVLPLGRLQATSGRTIHERDQRSFTGRKRIRKSFGRIPEVAPMPNLIDVQRSSYEAFLQSDIKPDSRTHTGLQEVFKSVFPIDDFAGRGRWNSSTTNSKSRNTTSRNASSAA
jgi:DNA-directed RNA polymerase beta subunit